MGFMSSYPLYSSSLSRLVDFRVGFSFYWVLPSFTEFYIDIRGLFKFNLVLLGFYRVLLGLTGFD